jgi:hypothetical protein
MGWGGRVTHRQHLAHQYWLSEEWNRPSRSDYYQMQTAAQVHSVPAAFSSKPSKQPGADKFKIKFKTTKDISGGDKVKSTITREEAARRSKDFSMAMLGFTAKSFKQAAAEVNKPSKYHPPSPGKYPGRKPRRLLPKRPGDTTEQ